MNQEKTSDEDRYDKYKDFEGPDEEQRTRALRAKRRRDGHGGNSFVHGGDMEQCSHRYWKHRPGWVK